MLTIVVTTLKTQIVKYNPYGKLFMAMNRDLMTSRVTYDNRSLGLVREKMLIENYRFTAEMSLGHDLWKFAIEKHISNGESYTGPKTQI